jgi:hypothetical protein
VSAVSIESVKRDLRIIHDDDDVLLQELIDSAERECLQFINAEYLPGLEPTSEEASSESVDPVVDADVARAIRLIVRGGYEETDVTRLPAYRSAAESLLMPYREGLGV